ncbi:disulfide bond formation protein B [Novosphingobium terrae]|uniref:disulfide bond formation protein B n=1 Tax=Novosphingobium terrae TaxID=2726189 RepID=UPI00197DDFC2|nr:disulfide bond formation protein B [Novosphingobium terrae]
MTRSQSFDALALAGVCLCLAVAFFYQLAFNELPCAFCNLEREGFMLFGGGLLLNIRHGTSPWNHVMSAFGALVGSLIGLGQMFVHAPAGTPPVGEPFLGLHMYDWAYIVLTGAIFYALLSLAFIASARQQPARAGLAKPVRTAVSLLFVGLVAANLVSAFLENGFHPFKGGGQQHYAMLYDGDIMKP